VVGNGAREHALAWQFSKSKRNTGLFVAPGNAGTAAFATNLSDISVNNNQEIIDSCKKHEINLVFVGPEVPLSNGLVDDLEAVGIPAVGPRRIPAKLEASKTFSKRFMQKYGIPTAQAKIVESESEFLKQIKNTQGKVVLKMSGLASGKGVFESSDIQELTTFGLAALKHGPLLIEEFLTGYEVSVFALTDGKSYKLLPPCTDYKKAGEGNTGLNTGGMGAICPVPWIEAGGMSTITELIVEPTFKGFEMEKFDYRGVVYFGIMMTNTGPMLLEYNVRFGDPEAQVLLPLIENDFCNLSEAIVEQNLDQLELQLSDKTALCVVVASPGYPEKYKKDLPVSLPKGTKQQLIFHASTYLANETIYTNGGRCFSAVGLGSEILEARAAAYPAAAGITFPGAWFRHDIGNKIFGNS
jgi:phosphoribosylamine--glycine ligase